MTKKYAKPYLPAEVPLIRKLCKESLYFFGRELLGYTDSEPEPHERMCHFLQSDAPKKLLVGSRGIYKTSFGTIAKAMQLLLIDPNARILIVQNTETNAETRMKEIKSHFEDNPRVKQIFGDQIPKKKSGVEWSVKALRLNRTGVYGEASITRAGVDTQLASLHFTHILGDDVVAASKNDLKEHGLIIITPEAVAKATSWYKLTMHGLQINKPDESEETKVQFIVNRWAREDFASYIMENHLKSKSNPNGFEFLEMAAHKPDGSLLWPKGLSEERLRDIHKDQDDFMFHTQYECRPYNPSDLAFPVENNTYWEGKYPPGHQDGTRKYRIFALMDLADVKNAASCYTSMVVLWIDEDNHIWVGEAIEEKLSPSEKIELIHRMVRKYGLTRIHIEENLHNEVLKYWIQKERKEAGLKYLIEPLKHKNRNKEARIIKLQPWHNKQAIHTKGAHVKLRQEMKDFPFTHKRDVLDALAYALDFVRGPAKPLDKPEVDTSIPTHLFASDIKKQIKSQKALIYGGGGLFRKQDRNRLNQLDRLQEAV